jgi:hypothetical protein
MMMTGIPGKPSTQTAFGALAYRTIPPTGLRASFRVAIVAIAVHQ